MSTKKSKRYLIIKVITESEVTRRELQATLRNTLVSLFGECEVAKAGFKTIIFKENLAVIGCYSNFVDKLRVAIALTDKINQKAACLLTVRSSGTIRKAIRVMKGLPRTSFNGFFNQSKQEYKQQERHENYNPNKRKNKLS